MRNIPFFSFLALSFCFSLNAAQAQTPAQNKETAKKILMAVDAGDLNTFSMYVSPALVEHMPPAPGIQAANGFELAKMMIAGFHAGFPDGKTTILNIVAEGDKVVLHSRYTGTNTGSLMGMPITNKKIDIEQIDIIRFDAAGKGIEHWSVIDQLTMMQQLGVIPAGGK